MVCDLGARSLSPVAGGCSSCRPRARFRRQRSSSTAPGFIIGRGFLRRPPVRPSAGLAYGRTSGGRPAVRPPHPCGTSAARQRHRGAQQTAGRSKAGSLLPLRGTTAAPLPPGPHPPPPPPNVLLTAPLHSARGRFSPSVCGRPAEQQHGCSFPRSVRTPAGKRPGAPFRFARWHEAREPRS